MVSIGLVRCPHLLEVWHKAVVEATTTRCAELDNYLRVLSSDALENLLQREGKVNIEVALQLHWQVEAMRIVERHIVIPLNVVDVRVSGQKVVYNAEYKVLNLRVCKVEQQLCTTTTYSRLKVWVTQYPIRVLLVELALGINHLWLNPNAELHTVVMRKVNKWADAIRQLILADIPVTKSSFALLALILITKPTVVNNEHFATELSEVAGHICHILLTGVVVHALPRVEQHLASLSTIQQLVATSPAVE